MFSSAAVVAFKPPIIKPIINDKIEVGFFIAQEFQQQSWPSPCNYKYEERYQFYNDGRYRVAMISHGRGCGANGVYRPILRLDFATPVSNEVYDLERRVGVWQPVSKESIYPQQKPEQLAKKKYSHRIIASNDTGFYIEPSSGQFNDGGRGDNAFLYFTVNHPESDEGRSDMVTLGSCCNSNYEQGPEVFLQPQENFSGHQITLWYVPQLQNDGRKGKEYCWAENQVVKGVLKTKTWPCTANPMFVPFKN